MIKLEPTYTEFEVARILKFSEGASAADRGQGHAESRHELQPAGRGRQNTSFFELELRLADDHDLVEVSAFDGCQAKAVACALNTKSGQTALNWLCYKTVFAVFAAIDVSHGCFRMVSYSQMDTAPPPSGARFVVGPSGKTFIGMPVRRRTTASYIGTKLMKSERYKERILHIRTAYPMMKGPSRPYAEIIYADGAKSPPQDLPI